MTLAWIQIRAVLLGAAAMALVWWTTTAIAWCEGSRPPQAAEDVVRP